METINAVNYKNIIERANNKVQVTNNRGNTKYQGLPFVQNGPLNRILFFTLSMNDNNFKELGELMETISSPKVISVNFESAVNEEDEVYVELYEDLFEVVKVTLAYSLYQAKQFPKEYMEQLFNLRVLNILHQCGMDPGKAIKCHEEFERVVDSVNDYKLGNLFNIINLLEKDEYKNLMLTCYEAFSVDTRDVLSFKCSIKEFIELLGGELKLFLRFYTKSIQLNVAQKTLRGCIGITDVSPKLIPLFNIAGKVEDCFGYLNTPISTKAIDILKALPSSEINSHDKLVSAIMQNCLGLPMTEIKQIVDLIVHELVSVLIKKKEYLGNDMYEILIEQALRKYQD